MKLLHLVAGLLCIGMVCSASAVLAADEAAATITTVQNSVMVKASGAADWAEAKQGTIVGKNDMVKTGDNGMAMLQFPDGSTVALKPNTEITVDNIVWEKTARKVGISMSAGQLRAIVSKVTTPSEFVVKTPTAISGARGTTFYVLYDGDETRVFVDEDAVDFTSVTSGDSVVVVTGFMAIALKDGTLTGVRELTKEERDAWLAGWIGPVAETYQAPAAPKNLEVPESTKENVASPT